MNKKENGSILIVALALITLAAAVAVEITYRIRIEGETAKMIIDKEKSEILAWNGIKLAYSVLLKDDRSIDSSKDEWGKPIEFINGDGKAEVLITDEASRFPVNSILSEEGLLDIGWKTRLERLFEYEKLPASAVSSLIDYVDENDEIFLDGGELNYYSQFEPPRKPANRRLVQIDELRYVKDISESGAVELSKIITLFKSKININTASAPVLSSLIPAVNQSAAERIIARRDFVPFNSVSDLSDVLELSSEDLTELESICSVSTKLFRIESKGTAGSATTTIISIVEIDGDDFIVKYRKIM